LNWCDVTVQGKGYFVFEWSSLLHSRNKLGGGHTIKIGFHMSTKRHFAKAICIFAHNPKMFVELQKLVDLLDTKGNKLL